VIIVVGYMFLMRIYEFENDKCEFGMKLWSFGVLVKNECSDENLVI